MDLPFDPWRPLGSFEATRLIRRIQASGNWTLVSHAQDRLMERDIETTDCVNTIRRGTARLSDDTGILGLRYVVEARRMAVVVEIAASDTLFVVTAWRKEPC